MPFNLPSMVTLYSDLPSSVLVFEPCHEKTCLWGLQIGKTQTDLLSYGDKLESRNVGYRN